MKWSGVIKNFSLSDSKKFENRPERGGSKRSVIAGKGVNNW